METPPGDITVILQRLSRGERGAEEELVPLVYRELRRLAASYMRKERSDHTLQATALVHEAYLRLVEGEAQSFQNRSHFFAVAAQMMRRILVDHARGVKAAKRQGAWKRVPLDEGLALTRENASQWVAVDEALTRLSGWDARQAKVVELRFFGGLSLEETADVLGVSVRTVKRDWSVARAWLHGELSRVHGPAGAPLGTN